MTHLIDKDALVAEIEKYLEYANNGILYAQNGIEKGLKKYERDLNAWQHCQSMCNNILSFIGTLEVKKVDLDEEINKWQGCEAFPEGTVITPLPKAMEIVERTAKHFYELGLNARKM